MHFNTCTSKLHKKNNNQSGTSILTLGWMSLESKQDKKIVQITLLYDTNVQFINAKHNYGLLMNRGASIAYFIIIKFHSDIFQAK